VSLRESMRPKIRKEARERVGAFCVVAPRNKRKLEKGIQTNL